MKFLLQEITEAGITQQEDFSASQWDLDSFDVQFPGMLHFQATARKLDTKIQVLANIHTVQKIHCSRCLEYVDRDFSFQCEVFYDSEHLKPSDYLDIDAGVREELLLDFPMKVICRQDCAGLCPCCGANLNLKKCTCLQQMKR